MVDTAGHPLRIGVWVVVVALELSDSGFVDQLTGHLRWARLAGVDVDDVDVDGQWAQRPRRRFRGASDRDAALGGSESVDDDRAEPLGETIDVTRRALVAVGGPQGVIGVVGLLGCGQHVRQRLADVVGVRDAIAPDVGKEL